MLISIIRYLQGYLKIRVTGYSPERFLNLCKNKKIAVWGLESGYNAYDMYINIKGFRKLKPILKKTQTRVSILERLGLPFFFHKYRKRKLFFGGISVCFVIVYSMTFFIWNIDLQGNLTITDDVLFEYLESAGISHGMMKHEVDCEQIVKDIRLNFNEIIWVSASLEGTKLSIHVKENTDTHAESTELSIPSDIISDKTGIIVDIVTRKGTPKVKAGDEVQAGDLLVSGAVEVLNDAKEVVSVNYTEADADIILETIIKYRDSIDKTYEKKVYTGKTRTRYYTKIKDMTFRFGWLKNSFKNQDYYTKEKQMKLGENFYLPIFTGQQKILEYKRKSMEYSKEEMKDLLNEKFELFCNNLTKEGARILEKKLFVSYNEKGANANADIVLQQSTGINRKIVDLSQPPMLE